ncbi:glycosyltransferase family 2 protein [Auriscalpium vulgare]|uniref:Glycosyltransferase family 2 protein n=1 Tax=Auriscalpium vulgare TaxID=40419 RepID=A0ACB8S1Q1_9AGAM|nr:glycosyltransferase family 2 protein [Auriscalpium vulgare]
MSHSKGKLIVVTGGNGFIGSHVAAKLHESGHLVRVVDIAPQSAFNTPICSEQILGDLTDPTVCNRAVRGAHTVLHFAAAMGGMGTIHAANDFVIYEENHKMSLNLLHACLSAGVKKFFYASSACVYPECLQSDSTADVSLRESDAWAQPPPQPQGLYGLEKIASELLIHQFRDVIDVRIARFHNVYGPRGAWMNGREKVPAALIRKAIAAQLLGSPSPTMEIWGDGTQRRSFLYIDDCVDAILKIIVSENTEALNVGSDTPVTVSELARLALGAAGTDPSKVNFQYDDSRPVGVASRNSNNEAVGRVLNWRPRTALADGIHMTAEWIRTEMTHTLDAQEESQRTEFLRSLLSSRMVDLTADCQTTFAILLPITSRGTDNPETCLTLLGKFAHSLERTTYRDTHALGGTRYHVKIYLAIDEDDEFLRASGPGGNRAEEILRTNGFLDVVSAYYSFPKGHVCRLWAASAQAAWKDRCDYFVLMGDDVEILDEGWMRDAVAVFSEMAQTENVCKGFGCVAFTDLTFPGMPTFPIIHRTHLDIFGGEVIPEIFINQDGDPFLYQLYRRWNCSRMFPSRLRNTFGGSTSARYDKQHAQEWTFDTLDKASATVQAWLVSVSPLAQRKLTLDVIVPCYRVDMQYLEPILQLAPSPTATTMFIIIVDNPNAPALGDLLHRYSHRPDVRIRVNARNLGASASRNRGLTESAAEWAIFLDDDVRPAPDLLACAEDAIRARPLAAGFVGTTLFPQAESVFTTAVHLAGVTYFWDISTKIPDDVPWGVTANLVARRNVRDNVCFDLQFPKTGGGEDIDFCRQKRARSLENGGEGFGAAPLAVVTHPWWNGGRRSYHRFYMWSKGDGSLVKMYPDLVYRDAAPNSAELALANFIMLFAGMIVFLLMAKTWILLCSVRMAVAIFIANISHDMYRHLWRDTARTLAINSTVRGLRWAAAVVESALIRMFSEWGRVVGLLQRGEWRLLGHRFDWFAGRVGSGPMDEERMNSKQRLMLVVVVFSIMLYF